MNNVILVVSVAVIVGAGVIVVAATVAGYQRQNADALDELAHRVAQVERFALELDKRHAPTGVMPARPPVPDSAPQPAAGPDLGAPPPTPTSRPWVEADLTAIRARTEGRHRARRPNPEDSDR